MKLFGVKMPKIVQRILTNIIVLYGMVILSLIYVLDLFIIEVGII